MLFRQARGKVADKPHMQFRDQGALLYEECITRDGFDGPYTIVYRRRPSHAVESVSLEEGWSLPVGTDVDVSRRHFRTTEVAVGGSPLSARVPLLFNPSIVVGVLRPTRSDELYWVNADADELFYVQSGGGAVHTVFGVLAFGEGDYVFVPKGVVRMIEVSEGPQHWLAIELTAPLELPRNTRNNVGQLKMGAPYSERDFRCPEFVGERPIASDRVVIKTGSRFQGYRLHHSPFDAVGWDGTVYPFVFPITKFQPKVGALHLPPTVHGTFSNRDALICSFVPRLLDFHAQSVPCPYIHSSVDVDEILFYSRGAFTSRVGVGASSLTHHPAGVAHGPHPGRYEGSVGQVRTDELAVMLDSRARLYPTMQSLTMSVEGYDASFSGLS